MTAPELIRYLHKANAKMTASGNELKIRVNKHLMTLEVIESIKVCKMDILDHLVAANEYSIDNIDLPVFEFISEQIPPTRTNHEYADDLINSLCLHDDQKFVYKKLLSVFDSDRLALAHEYMSQWKQGSDAETVEIKKENAGRYRANVWLRELFK